LKVCTAGDAPGDWRSFRLREQSMRAEENGDGFGLPAARLQLKLPEVRDECSFGDFAGGVGHEYCFR
jgi:hypothetical protein